ncbi:Sodium/calcium antiporter [Roseibacterium elongatum DSM 19469]|uniref:Sodium/calcium antiporter n=1 Tax=Roseicyclus elongatus DSM 19469 TaxID=1294273 RepID=W8RV74_9RHOB|nr:cation transporter [Roseibacterium elongatum]AHM05104.1 Sodium/calcium antiporter [Roseibacterium elongatum DSM 19469]
MFAALSLPLLIAVGAAAALVILVCGLRMTGLADRIADRTGWGEAVIGGVLLGAATSFSGTIVSLTSALSGDASLAFSNGIGGIAAQTAFLALADMLYRRANLEHAAAELANVFQCGLLLLLLSVPLVAFSAPAFTIWAVHPASLVLVGAYAIGVVATARLRQEPMWHPVDTPDTRPDEPDDGDDPSQPARGLIVQFILLMGIMGVAGWIVAQLAGVVIARYELSSSVVGALMTAVVTSLPELVTTLAAVRRGALQLAVGGIIGGNTFDILFLTISDIGYRDGSLFHAVGSGDLFWLSVALLMSAVLLLGLIYRERSGPGRIGLESAAMLLIYGGAIAIQTL